MLQHRTYDLVFYGDDFTGATDALEFLVKFGVTAVLFLEVPDSVMLDKFPHIQAFGVAGATRAMPTAQLKKTIEEDFTRLKPFIRKFLHYKVCSTFDSSKEIGNIGAVIETARDLFPASTVPVLGGMPLVGRYCAFGNLFVRMGIGTNGAIHRLDRHPSMKQHPVTPSYEADLCLLIEDQSLLSAKVIDLETMKRPLLEWPLAESDVVVLDALEEIHLALFQQYLDQQYQGNPLFCLGSSGVEAGFGMIHGKKEGVDLTISNRSHLPLLVVSGSQSPITKQQIQSAAEAGFYIISIDTHHLNDDPPETIIKSVIHVLSSGQDVLLHSGDRLVETVDSIALGSWYGKLATAVCAQVPINKFVICGGDTSSFVARAMQILAVEVEHHFIAGAPICKVHSDLPHLNGLLINVKGGQVGGPNYLIDIKSK